MFGTTATKRVRSSPHSCDTRINSVSCRILGFGGCVMTTEPLPVGSAEDYPEEEDVAQSEGQVTLILEELANHWRMPVVCLCDGSEPAVCYMAGFRSLQEKTPRLSGRKEIAVLLNSLGGNVEAAYWVVKALRRHVDSVNVLVPDRAKSAGTLICLGADAIFLGPYGELGPLDVQKHDTKEGSSRRVSPLQTFRALEHLRRHSIETMNAIVMELIDKTSWGVQDAISHTPPMLSAMLTPVFGPMYQQVNPDKFGEELRDLQIGEEYARRVMRQWGYSDRSERFIESIAHKLTWDYPSHGFIIDLEEAESLELKVKELDEQSEELCWDVLNATDDVSCIDIVFPRETKTNGRGSVNGRVRQPRTSRRTR